VVVVVVNAIKWRLFGLLQIRTRLAIIGLVGSDRYGLLGWKRKRREEKERKGGIVGVEIPLLLILEPACIWFCFCFSLFSFVLKLSFAIGFVGIYIRFAMCVWGLSCLVA
jgi:hypothetical protein